MKVSLPKSVDVLIKKYWNDALTINPNQNYSTNYELLNDLLQLKTVDHPEDKATIDWMRNNFDRVLSGIVNGYTVMGNQESIQYIPQNNDNVEKTITINRVRVPPMIDAFIQEDINLSSPLESISSLMNDEKYDDNSYFNQTTWITAHPVTFLSAVVNGYIVTRYFYVSIDNSQYYVTTDGTTTSYSQVLNLSDSEKYKLVFTDDQVTQKGWWSYAHDLSDSPSDKLFPSDLSDYINGVTDDYNWEKLDDGNDSEISL